MAFSLITSIDSALHHLKALTSRRSLSCSTEQFIGARKLKIVLRNLKVCLVLADAVHLSISSLPNHFSNIIDAIETICKDIEPSDSFWKNLGDGHFVNVALSDTFVPGPLTRHKVAAIAALIVDSSADFMDYIPFYSDNEGTGFQVMDAFKMQMEFLKGFMLLSFCIGVNENQMESLLVHIRPVVTSASCVFMSSLSGSRVYEEVRSKCSVVNRMATDHQICEAYTQALSISALHMQSQYAPTHPRCDDDDVLAAYHVFLDPLVSLLWFVLRLDSSHLVSLKHHLRVIYETLRSARAILKQRPNNFNEALWNQMGVLICHAAILLCWLQQTDINLGHLSYLCERIDTVFHAQCVGNASQASYQFNFPEVNELATSDLTNIIQEFDAIKISDGSDKDVRVHSHDQDLLSTSEFVGFQNDEVTPILNGLIRGSKDSKQLRTVLISGMGGIGKTTLALHLYNHPSVIHHFHARAWCTISQVLDKKKVILELLNQTQREIYSLNMTEDDLANKLYRSLKGKRYLIFLDDMWTNEAWNNLSGSFIFPDDYTQSRIILTSRHHDITDPRDGETHSLRLREDHECLEILKTKLPCWSLELEEIGMKFAQTCKGVPLSVVIVAGLLATTKQEGWKKILDNLRSSAASGFGATLELSYKHLPDYLKPCFLYLGVFPEDAGIYARRLVRLWMAEEFVSEKDLRRTEDVAREYLDELIQRSLVMVGRNGSIGGAKTLRIHDLVHKFCVTKIQQNDFFHILQQRYDQLSDFNEPPSLQRLSIHSSSIHFKSSELFCPDARSLVFFYHNEPLEVFFFDMSFIIQIFKRLKVLDIVTMSTMIGIPSEIELLIQLKYLSVLSCLLSIPSSIGNLSNLETFIAYFSSDKQVVFPHTLWDLQKLKYLTIGNSSKYGFTLPIESLENSSSLLGLEAVSGVTFDSDDDIVEKQMSKFPNIRRLNCKFECDLVSAKESMKKVVPEFLNQLESLSICGSGKLKFELGSSNENLRKLKMEGLELSREEVAVIGKLPNLDVLKLRNISFSGGALEMEEGDFSQLRLLTLYDDRNCLQKWTASDDQLPRLQRVVLDCCKELKVIPSSCLETSSTLEEIEVVDCSSILSSLVRDIQEVQKDSGYLIKVHIYSKEAAESHGRTSQEEEE